MLKLAFSALLLFIVFPVYSQWSDNFSDLDFKQNPTWFGDTSKFIISTAGELQLNALFTDTKAALFNNSTISLKASWDFKVRFEFNSSSTNYAKVYLMSDTFGSMDNVNGYYVRIGYTNDEVNLYKQTGTTSTLLIDGTDKLINTTTVNAHILVERDSAGNWKLFCDSIGGENYKLQGTAHDNTILDSKYFGLQCIFTSTRANKIFFDDFNTHGESYIPPKPPIQPGLFDVIITEIMADPTPSVYLPEYEYIELYNRSDTNFNTKGWKLAVGNSVYTLPDTSFTKHSYLVLSQSNSAQYFKNWCKPLDILGSGSTLTNTGSSIILKNNKDSLVSWVNYNDSWYVDSYKGEGGWSLEVIDPENFCGRGNNWIASKSKWGGTPGSINSVNAINSDIENPDLESVYPVSDTVLRLTFSESIHPKYFDKESFELQNTGNPNNFVYVNGDFDIADIYFNSKLGSDINMLLVKTRNTKDCALNPLSESTLMVALPLEPDSADVVLNEILFDAEAYCPEYFEIYNRSQKILNAADFLVDFSDGTGTKSIRIESTGRLFYPGSYLVITSNKNKLGEFFTLKSPQNLIENSNVPSLNDKSGSIKLKTLSSKVIDYINYNSSMQLATLINKEGVALERINPNLPGWNINNWHSAAETAGFGTPGYLNSQYAESVPVNQPISIEKDIFSPDNDGFEDILSITYKLEQPGSRVFLWIYNSAGIKIKELLNNVLPDAEGNIYWDGISGENKLCTPGIYIAFARIIEPNGTAHEYKLPFTLAIRN